MEIELKSTFIKAIGEGINLFIGAGFSKYASDKNGVKLPLGSELAEELTNFFPCPKINDLSKICTVIDSINSEGLREFMVNRFDVANYEKFYANLIRINCKRIFTTNIDNLIDKIFENTNLKFINNVFINGPCFQDSRCVDFIPIHGSIEMPDSRLLFNKQEVTGSFRTQINSWLSLNQAAQQLPSLFLGYSLEDVGAIESLFGQQSNIPTQKTKWILIHKSDEGTEAYFKAMGFKIIIADIKVFLEYIGTLDLSPIRLDDNEKTDSIEIIYPSSKVPRNNYKGQIRPIDEFFLGAAPIWSDILSNRIYTTSHLDKIIDLVNQKKSVVVTGIPASGKSTLLLQLAKKLSSVKRVLIFNELSLHKSNVIRNEIRIPTVILIDNFASNIDSFVNLAENANIKLVGFDRYYNVDISGHKLPKYTFNFYDVSDLELMDIQGIYNMIPLSIRKSPMLSKQDKDEIPSVFEIVNYNIKKPALISRYKSILSELDKSDPVLLDLLIMTCYLHSCRVPVSFEVTSSFLDDEVNSYEEVFEIIESLTGMVQETIGTLVDDFDDDQDYYQPRSQILAETIISQTKAEPFRRVFTKFHDKVPSHQIPNYYIFKRRGYDAFYVAKAFGSWREGLDFYEKSPGIDRNPFLLQQCSLFLLKKKRFTEAAIKIDKARQVSKKKIFSVENTHAIVLFKANINSTSDEAGIKSTLDRSMQILIKCYSDDQRKTYHAITFAEQALEYYAKFPDDQASEYVNKAVEWLKEVGVERKYNYRIREILKQLEDIT